MLPQPPSRYVSLYKSHVTTLIAWKAYHTTVPYDVAELTVGVCLALYINLGQALQEGLWLCRGYAWRYILTRVRPGAVAMIGCLHSLGFRSILECQIYIHMHHNQG